MQSFCLLEKGPDGSASLSDLPGSAILQKIEEFYKEKMKAVIKLIKDIKEKRRMIWELAKADFRKRFVGSYFGIVWMFVQPLVTIAIYAFIFGPYGFKSAPPVPNVSYTMWLVPGIIPWLFFSEALSMITGILQEYSYLVKKVVFPVELLPVIKLISCLFVHCFFLIVMVLFCFLNRNFPRLSWIQALYYSFAASVLALGFGFITCTINVFFKDMQQIVSILLQFGIWLCPIMYDETLFTSRAPWIGTVLKLNPFYYIVAGFRDSMLTGSPFWMRPTLGIYFWAVTLAVFLFGLNLFTRMRPHFSDVL